MANHLLLVDLENVQNVSLASVPTDCRVLVFYGIAQKKIPEDVVVQAQPLGDRLRWMKIAGQGHNALDFHIAFYLGAELALRPATECTILSGDTGFDPLVKHLGSLGHVCRRVTILTFPNAAKLEASAKDDFDRLLILLKKEKALPKRRRGLDGKLKSWFPNGSPEARAALAGRLVAAGVMLEAGTTLSFCL